MQSFCREYFDLSQIYIKVAVSELRVEYLKCYANIWMYLNLCNIPWPSYVRTDNLEQDFWREALVKLKPILFGFSIDASADGGGLGRLVNDDHLEPNCKVMKIEYDKKPHLCLFALTKISPGEEITFNYGGYSYLWRSKVGLFIFSN